MMKNIDKLKKIFKARQVQLLKCDKCESLSLDIIGDIQVNGNVVSYKIKCDNCESIASVTEIWEG